MTSKIENDKSLTPLIAILIGCILIGPQQERHEGNLVFGNFPPFVCRWMHILNSEPTWTVKCPLEECPMDHMTFSCGQCPSLTSYFTVDKHQQDKRYEQMLWTSLVAGKLAHWEFGFEGTVIFNLWRHSGNVLRRPKNYSAVFQCRLAKLFFWACHDCHDNQVLFF